MGANIYLPYGKVFGLHMVSCKYPIDTDTSIMIG